MRTLLICLYISVLCLFLFSGRSFGDDYRYEACVPSNCGQGPNISFPFYINGVQQPYCGRGFGIVRCSNDGFPLLQLPENECIIDDIFYQTRTVRVRDSTLRGCFSEIRNTSLPLPRLNFVDNVTMMHLFSNCSSNSVDLQRNIFGCGGNRSGDSGLALYHKDGNFTNALENCSRYVIVPVEKQMDGGNLDNVLGRGFVLSWRARSCRLCETSGGRCGFNETTNSFSCFCPDGPDPQRCTHERSDSTMILATAIPGAGVVFVLCIFSFAIWRYKRIRSVSLLRTSTPEPDIEISSNYYGIPLFSYNELEAATKNFDNSNKLGDGGFGAVYYGKLGDGREVAVKRLYEHNYRRIEQFMNEIKILTCIRHPNLVSLYGCTSRTSKELLLVYKYIPNGTLAYHLHGDCANKSPLTWSARMNIAIETANALAYLHSSGIVHRDVKTDNILLDDNFCVKVADFGLSRLFPCDATHVSTSPQGTLGYVDPEYFQSYRLTEKSDVFSFGVVLAELVSSMPAVDVNRHRHEINLANLVVSKIQMRGFDEFIDPSLGYKSDAEVTRMTTLVAELAFQCLQLEKEMRPSMDEILDTLTAIKKGEDYLKDENERSCVTSPGTDDVVLLKNKNVVSSHDDKFQSL